MLPLELLEGRLPFGRRREHHKLMACAQRRELERLGHGDKVGAIRTDDPLKQAEGQRVLCVHEPPKSLCPVTIRRRVDALEGRESPEDLACQRQVGRLGIEGEHRRAALCRHPRHGRQDIGSPRRGRSQRGGGNQKVEHLCMRRERGGADEQPAKAVKLVLAQWPLAHRRLEHRAKRMRLVADGAVGVERSQPTDDVRDGCWRRTYEVESLLARSVPAVHATRHHAREACMAATAAATVFQCCQCCCRRAVRRRDCAQGGDTAPNSSCHRREIGSFLLRLDLRLDLRCGGSNLRSNLEIGSFLLDDKLFAAAHRFCSKSLPKDLDDA